MYSSMPGFWTPPNTLNIPDAGHHKVAFTSKKHVVQYALQAVLLVFEDPAHFPNKIRVWDDNRYVHIFLSSHSTETVWMIGILSERGMTTPWKLKVQWDPRSTETIFLGINSRKISKLNQALVVLWNFLPLRTSTTTRKTTTNYWIRGRSTLSARVSRRIWKRLKFMQLHFDG